MSELDKLIENYFAPRSKTFTKHMLYEMIDEVLEEKDVKRIMEIAQDTDDAKTNIMKAAGKLEKLLEPTLPDVEIHTIPKSARGQIIVTNAGGREARHKIITTLADKKIAKPNKKDLKDGRLYYKGTIDGINFELRRGKSKDDAPTATEFEDFLAAAIENNSEKLKQEYNQKYSKDIVDMYLEIATNIITGAGDALKGKKVTKLSGGGNRCRLTQRYVRFDVTSTEPKTDFKVGADRVSVKRKAASQYASAQYAEAAAMIDYVLLKQRSHEKVRTFVKELIESSLNKDEFYKLRNKRANTEGTTCKTAFDKLLTAYIFAVPTENAEDRKELASFVEEIGVQISEEVLKEYQAIFSGEEFKKGLLREAMTGEGKFGVNSPCTATYLLEWDKDNPNNTSYEIINDDLIGKKVKLTKFRIADRGDGRGGCVRLDALKEFLAGAGYADLVSTPQHDAESTATTDYPTLEDYVVAYFAAVMPVVEEQISKLEGLDLLNFFGDQIKFELEWEEPLSLISDD